MIIICCSCSAQIRCFLYKTKPGGGGFHIAESASPSCGRLSRAAQDGVRRFNVKAVPAQQQQQPRHPGGQEQQRRQQQGGNRGCRFPPWATRAGSFFTFYYTSEYRFDSTELTIYEYNYLNKKVRRGKMLKNSKIWKLYQIASSSKHQQK